MKNKLREIIYYITTAAVASGVLIMFVIFPGINDNTPSMFGDTIYGKAHKPYVYRTLLPSAVRLLSSAVPNSVRSSISDKIESNISLKKLFIKLKWEKELAVEYSFAMLLMFLSLWGFTLAIRYLFQLFYETSPWYSYSVSLLALIGLPPMFQYTSFVYDFPLLFLYTLGLIFLYKQDWKSFLVLYFIACINKETTILLTLIFYIYYKGMLKSELFRKLLAAQIAIFVVVKLVLYLIYTDNPGGLVEFHLIDHNLRLLTGYELPLIVSILGIILLIFYKWEEKPDFLRKSMVAFIPLIVLTFFLGYLDELRDYYEVYPTVVIMISYSIARIMELQIKLLKKLDN
ncbi:hypothetical protein ACFLSS_02945 [Bacteroidota bacterium]